MRQFFKILITIWRSSVTMSYSFKHKFCHALTHTHTHAPPPLFKMLCIQCQVLAFKTPRSNTATTVTMSHTIQLKETIYESHLNSLIFPCFGSKIWLAPTTLFGITICFLQPFDSFKWLASSNFFLQYHSWITHLKATTIEEMISN